MSTIITLVKTSDKGNISQWVFTEMTGHRFKAVNSFGKRLDFSNMEAVDESISWFMNQGYTRRERPARPVKQAQQAEMLNIAPF